MSAPDFSRGYLRVPHAVWRELFCRAPLSRRQLQLVAVVLRESWGWRAPDGGVRTWTRPLTHRQLAAATGIAREHVSRELRRLLARGVLLREGRRYRLVADPARWKTAPPAGPEPHPPGPEAPRAGTETVPPPPAPQRKEEKDEKRNVRPPSGGGFSTGGDNPPLAGASLAREASREPPVTAAPLVEVVAAFAGPLPEATERALRRRIAAAGIAGAWAELEPALRRGDARSVLRKLTGEETAPEAEDGDA